MNVISHLPRWAQGPTQKFLAQEKIEGTKASPMDQDSFEQSFNQAAGVLMLAGNDEVPGEDQAMGEPGVVRRNGATIYFDGDSSDPHNQVDAIVLGSHKGIQYATYVQSRPDGFSSLKMANDDGSIELQGSVAQIKAGGIQGYLLAGDVTADPR